MRIPSVCFPFLPPSYPFVCATSGRLKRRRPRYFTLLHSLNHLNLATTCTQKEREQVISPEGGTPLSSFVAVEQRPLACGSSLLPPSVALSVFLFLPVRLVLLLQWIGMQAAWLEEEGPPAFIFSFVRSLP
mmetsp:Transcript_12282/g.23808  ORF Transcript_12282/g.23808 Transcript_12282/m.23808 type:complete len:131 (+) Transcript_12282:1915-2307(+)